MRSPYHILTWKHNSWVWILVWGKLSYPGSIKVMEPFQCFNNKSLKHVIMIFIPNYTFLTQLSDPQCYMVLKIRDLHLFLDLSKVESAQWLFYNTWYIVSKKFHKTSSNPYLVDILCSSTIFKLVSFFYKILSLGTLFHS